MGWSRTEALVLQDLGDGLILRRATEGDIEALVAFNKGVHQSPDEPGLPERVAVWTCDLMSHEHPTFDVGDFTVVEDTNTGAIVSSLCLISQRWSYDGIEFGVGRVELVGTHPNYRNRGLIRAQFEVLHRWSAERGEKMQAITGIPYFYRQFGYEMGLALGGGRLGYAPNVPKLEDEDGEPYRVRQAEEADLAFIGQMCEQAAKRYLLTCVRDKALLRYELSGRSEKNLNRHCLCIVEAAEGEPVGFLTHSAGLWHQAAACFFYELKPGISWLAVTPSVVRYLWATGEGYAEREGKDLGAFAFWLGTEHPVYRVMDDQLPRTRKPYAWYVRVPNLIDFLQHLTPVLERRLADSVLVGHTGELKVSFYRDGLRLEFEEGRLKTIESWQPTPGAGGTAAFPNLTFLQLLLGHRTCEELHYAFPDCWTANDEARTLLEVLFPKRSSLVWGVS
ncbi:MAG: GNAT family N-acetyltransferase [Anaerolineae bacterium]|nr:GNAT family N-acetyltransferase [Anaerolineae bacterium]